MPFYEHPVPLGVHDIGGVLHQYVQRRLREFVAVVLEEDIVQVVLVHHHHVVVGRERVGFPYTDHCIGHFGDHDGSILTVGIGLVRSAPRRQEDHQGEYHRCCKH